MPNIPDFAANAKQPSLHAGGAPEISPSAMRAAGEASARLGQAQETAGLQLSDQMASFNQKYAAAAQAADVSHYSAQSSEALGDLQHKWSLTPNRAEAQAGFDKEAADVKQKIMSGILDPVVAAQVGRSFDQETISRRYDTANSAFRLESSARVAQLDGDLNSLANSAAGASNGVLQAQLVDQANQSIARAVDSGWMDPTAGEKLKLNFGSQVQEVRARSLMNDAIESQDGTKAAAISEMLDDPNQFKGLLPERREVLQTRLDNLSYRLDQRAASQQAHKDAVADKQLHQDQAHNEAVLLAGIDAGKVQVSDSDLQRLADTQQITAGGVEAIVAAKKRVEAGTDDPQTTLRLWHAIGTKTASSDMIFDAQNTGQLSRNTAATMMQRVDSQSSKAEDQKVRGLFEQLKTALHGNAIEQGYVPDKAPENAAWAQAQGEWHRRIGSGEDPQAVATDMLKRYGDNTAAPTWLDKPKMGSVGSSQDLEAVIKKTAGAANQGKISQGDYQAQLKLLSQYKNYYGLPAPKTPKAGATP